MSQPLKDNYAYLARYNAWINRRLYDACGQLPDEERRRLRGAFFGSVHGTLNHLLWGDLLWLQRFAAQGTSFPALDATLIALPAGAVHGTVLHADWAEMRLRRERLDGAIVDWVTEMPVEFPLQTLRYANTAGAPREHPVWQALTHFFNHQTHHRGQVTTLLTQCGVDIGATDMVAMPGL